LGGGGVAASPVWVFSCSRRSKNFETTILEFTSIHSFATLFLALDTTRPWRAHAPIIFKTTVVNNYLDLVARLIQRLDFGPLSYRHYYLFIYLFICLPAAP
jgi:hypothetical protein